MQMQVSLRSPRNVQYLIISLNYGISIALGHQRLEITMIATGATLFRWAAQKQTSTPCITHAIIWESGRFLTFIPSVGSMAKPSPIKNARES